MDKWKQYCLTFKDRIIQRHVQMLHKPCNIDKPILFTDKLEWLKLHDSTHLKTLCSDKIDVKSYVASQLQDNSVIIPTLKTFNKFDDIQFDQLPPSYVLKTNHGPHTNIIVRNNDIDIGIARRKFNKWMETDWSWYGYELNYINIPRRILVEPLMIDGTHTDLTDYKFGCFNGTPLYCQVISDRHGKNKHLNYYDMNWRPCTDMERTDFPANYTILDNKPRTFDLMKTYAEKLAAPFKFVRVDFYEINGKLYFGELTFIPAAAYIKYTNPNTDLLLGNQLHLDV